MTNEDYEKVLNVPVTRNKTIELLASIQREQERMSCICKEYNVTPEELINEYIIEMVIPGMTVGIAWQAMSFLTVSVERKENVPKLRQAIRNSILMAGVYMTNVSASKRAELEGRQQ